MVSPTSNTSSNIPPPIKASSSEAPAAFQNPEMRKKIEQCNLCELPQGQFALMHGDAFILNSGLEGGQSTLSLEYWSDLANKLQKGELEDLKELFHPIGKSLLAGFDKMARHLNFAKKADKLLRQGEPKQINALYKEISSQLQKEGVAYLPIGYSIQGKEKSDGHAFTMVLKRDKKKRKLTAYFLNKGEGSERHPILQVNPQKVMRSYKSYSITFDDQTLFSSENEEGSKALLRLLSLYRLAPSTSKKPYEASEIYDYLLRMGKIEITKGEYSEEFAVTSSRSGVCSEAVARLIIRDSLVHSDAPGQLSAKNSYKRFILFGEMASLIQKIQEEDSSLSPHLIIRSAQEFSYSALKKHEREEITLQELSYCQMIERIIYEKYEPKTHKNPTPLLIESALGLLPELGSSMVLTPAEDKGNDSLRKKKLQDLPKGTPDPAECLSFLRGVIKNIKDGGVRFVEEDDAAFISYIQKLPIPLGIDSNGRDEPYWSKIPQNQIDDLLDVLQVLYNNFIRFRGDDTSSDYFLLTLSLLSIYDNLIRSKPEMKLEGFNPLASLLLDLQKKEKEGIFHLKGEDSLRFAQILNYLEKRGKKAVFPSYIETEVVVPSSSKEMTKESVFQYYSQFIDLFPEEKKELPWDRKIWELVSLDEDLKITHKINDQAIVVVSSKRSTRLPNYYYRYEQMYSNFISNYHNTDHQIDSKAEINWTDKKIAGKEVYSEKFLSKGEREELAKGWSSGRVEDLNAISAEYKFVPKPVNTENCSLTFRSKAKQTDLSSNEEHEITEKEVSSTESAVMRSLIQGKSYALLGDKKAIPLFFDWLKSHANVEESEWKAEFERFLLQPRGGIGTWLNLHLEDDLERKVFIASLRSYLDGVVDEFVNTSNHGESLWWIRLSAHVESHLFAFLPEEKRSKEAEESFQTRIDGLQEKLTALENNLIAKQGDSLKNQIKEIVSHQLYLHTLRPNLEESHLKHFIHSHFRGNILGGRISEKSPFWIKIDGEFWAHKYGKMVAEAALNPIFSEEILLSLQPLLGLPSQKLKWNKETDYPIYSITHDGVTTQVDLVAGVALQNGKKIESGSWPSSFKKWKHLNRFLDPNNLPEAIATGNKYYAADGSFSWSKMNLGPNNWVFGKVGAISSDPKGFYYYYQQNLLRRDELAKGKEVWYDPKNKNYIVAWPNGEPYALIDARGVHKLNAKGEKTGEILLIDSKNTFLGKFLNQFINSTSVLLWKKEGKITSLEIRLLEHLHFKLTPEGHYSSEQFPEYYLAPDQDNGAILKGSLLLVHKKEKEKKAVIFPFKKMRNNSPFSPEIKAGWSDVFFEGDEKGKRLFFYEIDQKSQRLRAEDFEGQLFLTYALIKKGAYPEALESLGHLATPSHLSLRSKRIIKDLMEETPIGDPIASALILHLLWVVRRKITVKRRFGLGVGAVSEGDISEDDIRAHGKNYNQYQKNELYSHIPEAYRLSNQELNGLKRTFGEEIFEMHHSEENSPPPNTKSFIHQEIMEVFLMNEEEIRDNLEDSQPSKEPVDLNWGYSKIKTRWDSKENFFDLVSLILASPPNQFSACDLILLNYIKNGNQQEVNIEVNTRSADSKKAAPAGHSASKKGNKIPQILYFIRYHQKDFKGVKLNIESIIERLLWMKYHLFSDFMNRREKEEKYKQIALIPSERSAAMKMKPKSSKENQTIDLSPPVVEKPFSYEEKPLSVFIDTFFDLEKKDVYQTDQKKFALVEREGESALARESRLKLEETHEKEIKNKQYSAYSLKDGMNATDLKKDLKHKIKDSQENLKTQKEKIMRLANGPSDEEFSQLPFDVQKRIIEHRAAVSGGQKRGISFNKDILLGLADRSFNDLRKLNPFITDKRLQEIKKLALQYLLESSSIDQGKEALDWVDRACKEPDKAGSHLTQAASILNKKRGYDPSLHPLLLFYEYASGMMLRNQPDQAALLQKIFTELFSEEEGVEKAERIRRLMFEFQAGGGKTKVISAIAAAYVISKGKVPVFYSLPELFEVTKEDLRHSLDDFLHKGIQTIHLTLNDPLTLVKLDEIFTTLEIAKQEKHAIVMTPESYHALKLGYRLALRDKDHRFIELHTKIRQFFLQNVVGLVDESHRNADSLLHDNIAFGTQQNLPIVHRSWLFMILKTLAGRSTNPLYTKSGKSVGDTVRLCQNNQAKMAEGEKEEVLEALKVHLSTHSALGIPPDKQEEVIQFWSDPKMGEPQWLTEKLRPENEGGNVKEFREAQLIYLTRGLFVDQILSTTLGLTGEIDYKASLDPKDPVPSPAKQGNPSTAKYEQPDISAIIAIQHYLQRGLTTFQELDLVVSFLKERAKTDSSLYVRFKEWQRERREVHDLKEVNLGELSNAKKLLLLRAIGQVPEVVELYVREKVLPQVTYSPFKLSTTPSDIVNDNFATLLFSATLGVQEKYPWLGVDEKRRFLQDFPFLAEVIHRACLPHNQRKLWIHPKSPTEFFEEFYKRFPTEFETRLDGIINYGGMCEELPSHAWSEALLNFSHQKKLTYDGTVYFATYRELGISPKEGESLDTRKLVVRLKDRLHPHIIEGSNLKAELKRLGLENKRLFKIYAPQDTTGTDLALAPDAMMAITFGGNADLVSLAQAILRERGFLNESIDENSQSLIWVGFPEVKEKIKAHLNISTDPTNEQIFQWALDQGSDKQISAVQALIYQEIEFVISRNIDRQIDQTESIEAKIAINKEHEKAFLKLKEHLPSNVYPAGREWIKEEERVRNHFQRYAKNHASEAKATLSDQENQHIQTVIDRRVKLVKEILDRKGESALSTAQQQYQQQSQSQQQSQQQSQSIKESLLRNRQGGLQRIDQVNYAKGNLRLDSPDLLEEIPSHASSANQLFQADFFKNLLVTEDAWNVLRMQGTEQTLTKPVCCFLMIKKGDSYRPMVVSLTNMRSYEDQIDQGKTLEGCQFCLFSMTGVPLKNGKGAAALSEEEFASPVFQDWLQDMLPRIQLMSGKILEPLSPVINLLLKSAEGRATLNQVWKKASEVLENPEEMDHDVFNSLMAEYISLELIGETLQGDYPRSIPIEKIEKEIPVPDRVPVSPKVRSKNRMAWESTGAFFRTRPFFFVFAILSLGIFPLTIFVYYRYFIPKNVLE